MTHSLKMKLLDAAKLLLEAEGYSVTKAVPEQWLDLSCIVTVAVRGDDRATSAKLAEAVFALTAHALDNLPGMSVYMPANCMSAVGNYNVMTIDRWLKEKPIT